MTRVLLDQVFRDQPWPFDADFHALLAVSLHRDPSVIRVRIEGLGGKELSEVLVTCWPRISASVRRGALVTVTHAAIRVRHLPVAGDSYAE